MIIFDHVDHVSHLRMPWGTAFVAEDGALHRVFSISALALVSDMVTLLAVCDRGKILRANITFNFSTLALAEIQWVEERKLLIEGGEPFRDMEGLAILPNGMLYTAAEREPKTTIWRMPPPPDWPKTGPILLHPFASLPPFIMQRIRKNRGIESLTTFPLAALGQSFLVAGFEGSLLEDAMSVRRLFEFDGVTGEVRCQKVLFVPENQPHLYLSELAALDDLGLCGGGQFLALLRGWSARLGNDIRLLSISAAGADEISHCSSVIDTESFPLPGKPPTADWCALQGITVVHQELLFKWTPHEPLAGVVPVDNYEGMVIIPPAALGRPTQAELGGIFLLLVNDDNDNPNQIGTQFVLLRLAFRDEARRQSLNDTSSVVLVESSQGAAASHLRQNLAHASLTTGRAGAASSAAGVLAAALVVLLFIGAALFGFRRWRRRRSHPSERPQQMLPIDAGASDIGECTRE